jgi:hypothetical protein
VTGSNLYIQETEYSADIYDICGDITKYQIDDIKKMHMQCIRAVTIPVKMGERLQKKLAKAEIVGILVNLIRS